MIDSSNNQRTLEWYRARLGCITGSRVSDIMKSGRKKDVLFGDTAMSYIYQVAGERMLNAQFVEDDGIFADYIEQMQTTSKAIQWGQEQEHNAIDILRRYHPEWEFMEVGSCRHDTIDHFAASPDGLVRMANGDLYVIEVKCPNVNTFMRYATEISSGATLLACKPEYYYQMQAEMSCTGAVAGIFITYCPWLSYPFHTAIIERSSDMIEAIEDRVRKANDVIHEIIETLDN